MSVVFGGKVICQKGQDAVDEYDDPIYGIQLLSKREKALLAELERTRSEIVEELITLGPSVSTADLEGWHNTIDTYERKLNRVGSLSKTVSGQESQKKKFTRITRSVPRAGKLRSLRTQSAAYQLGTPDQMNITALDFLPALSASSKFTEGKNNGQRGGLASSLQAIRLPILTLPAFGYKTCQSHSLPDCSTHLHHQTLSCVDPVEARKGRNEISAIILDDLDRYFIQQHLQISNEQMVELLLNLDAILGGSSSAEKLQSTVFNAVKEEEFYKGTFSNRNCIPNNSIIDHSEKYVDSRFTLSDSCHEVASVFSNSLDCSRSVSCEKTQSRSTGTRAKTTTRNQARKSLKESGPKLQKIVKASSHNSITDKHYSMELLRAELMRSLGNMQHHTAQVKTGILHVQDIAPLKSLKAKTFIATMAADQLFAVFKKVGLRQIRRGWSAWKLTVKIQNLWVKASLFKKFQNLRTVALLLDKLVTRVVGYKFLAWARTCITLRTQEEIELKTAAVLLVQRVVRGITGRLRVKKLRENRNFTRMHDALVKIQALFRCKLQHWAYQKYRRGILEDGSARVLQRVARGMLGRRRAAKIKLFQNKELNAVMIQAIARGLLGRKIAAERRLLRLKGEMAIRIQVVARRHISRARVKKMKRDLIERRAAVIIQARARGALARMNLHRRRKEAAAHQKERGRYAVLIQSVYRGHRARILFKYYMQEQHEQRALENISAVVLQCFVRCFVARARIRRLKEQQFDNWVANAVSWKEMWAEDSSSWFYFNEQTEEALWEPPPGGYKKSDGQLVLANGLIIDEPDVQGKRRRAAGEEHLCVECTKRVAIRVCEECGDGFCTKCYKVTHASGSRKHHIWKPAGPIDCTECEEELAERWCVSCDEAYCDSCWRKVHSKGKRRYHPFSQVQEDGHIDTRIFTIDGEQVSNYDATFAQNRHEDHQHQPSTRAAEVQDLFKSMDINEVTQEEEQYEGQMAVADTTVNNEWMQYVDDEGNLYWYNDHHGISQYEDPFE